MPIENIVADLAQNGRDSNAFQAFQSAAQRNAENSDGAPKVTFLDVLVAMLPATT